MRLLAVLLAAAAPLVPALVPAAAEAATKITLGTDWLAEAEHGGFYQAVATGIYAKHGLDVTIKPGGPQVIGEQQVAARVVDVQMVTGSAAALNLVKNEIPVVAVAALWQKNPQVLISHPGVGADTLAQMKGKPIMISAGARNGYWLWLEQKFGFTEDQIRPYNFQMAPFLADKTAIQQGFLSSEPYQIEKQGGFKPVVNLLADSGYPSYANVLLVRSEMVAKQPDLVQAIVDASIEGWYSYIYGDPAPANALILKDNKEMTQDVIDYSIKVTKQFGTMDSGDSLTLGVGAMTDARWKEFFDIMVTAGQYPKDMDYKKAYTLQFVNKKHAIEMRK